MNSIYFLLLSILFLIIVELIKRRLDLQPRITRRITHIGASLIACISPFFLDKFIIITLCMGFAFFMLFSRRIALFTSIHAVKRKTYGEAFLPLGEALSAGIFLPYQLPSFLYGVLVMGISDAVAGFIGENYGKHPIPFLKSKKTFEGAITFFFVTILITLLFIPGIGYHLIIVPLILTVTELILGYGTDNLVLPIAAGLLLNLISA